MTTSSVRLRQVALVGHELAPLADALQRELVLDAPFHDPGIAEFGLHNAVFTVGDTFIEVVAPLAGGTAAGRHLERLGGDGGYMALFQVPDMTEARRRVADLGVRVVWKGDFGDMRGTHLHPKDVPAAIVSLDWAEPAGSWRWGGPSWTATVPSHESGGLIGITVAVADARAVAVRWALFSIARRASSTANRSSSSTPGASGCGS